MTLEEYEIELVKEQIKNCKEHTKFVKEMFKREKLHQKHFEVMIQCMKRPERKYFSLCYQSMMDEACEFHENRIEILNERT